MDRIATTRSDSRSCPVKVAAVVVSYDVPLLIPDVPGTVALDRHILSFAGLAIYVIHSHRASRVGPRATDTVARGSRSVLRHCDARHPVRVSKPAPFNDRRATDNLTPPYHSLGTISVNFG